MASPPNPAAVPVVTYEYLFCLPSSEWPRPLSRPVAQGLLSGSCTPCIMGHWLWLKRNLDTTRLPPVAEWLRSHSLRAGYGPTTPS
jgi:hypothetical protein